MRKRFEAINAVIVSDAAVANSSKGQSVASIMHHDVINTQASAVGSFNEFVLYQFTCTKKILLKIEQLNFVQLT